jgi:mannosyltransferase OCH1-like enzyme
MIPKIIHQTAPTNKNHWHPLWFKCAQSWVNNYPDFEIRIWNDKEINDLVKEHYPKYWEMYNEFPVHIMKIDFVRFCFLHKFGGIYADMDMFCYKNFYEELNKDIYVLENPMGNDSIENSMMVSKSGHPFWIECMNLSLDRYQYIKRKHPEYIDYIKAVSTDKDFGQILRPYLVFFITGTNLISTAFRNTKLVVSTLPGIYYNNNDISYHPEYRTKHIHTGLWGKENIQINNGHNNLKEIPIDKYDFYTDYSRGNYLKVNIFDVDKNDNYGQLNVGVGYEYN